MDLTFADLSAEDGQQWNEIVAQAADGWFWSTSAMHAFRISVLSCTGRLVADKSFMAIRDGIPCGLAPLTIVRDPDGSTLKASYGDAPLPWPMLVDSVNDREAIEDAIFDEVERRTRNAAAGMISLMLSPPGASRKFDERFNRIVRKRSFVDTSYESHCLEIVPETPQTIRERYRRYVRKFSQKYAVEILSGATVPESLADTYMDLHVKDAGGVFRPLATYSKQVDLARKNEGFWVIAKSLATGAVVGMLLIAVVKGAAYDSSVAVDPAFQEEQISHLLKWGALEQLIKLGISHYELGAASITPTYLWQPSQKNYGISFFKDGWSRGQMKRVRMAEKFYSRDCLDEFWSKKFTHLIDHFAVG